jgi:hypothetical protein
MELEGLKSQRRNLGEYFFRANFLLAQAKAQHPENIRSFSIVYCIYALQAAFEVAKRAVSFHPMDKEKTKQLGQEFTDFVSGKVRYLYLVDALRSRDFHASPIIFSEGRRQSCGLIKLSVRDAGESVALFPDSTGRSTIYRAKDGKETAQPVHKDSVLEIAGFNVLEPESGKWMPIIQVLEEHGTDLYKLLLPEDSGSTVGSASQGL